MGKYILTASQNFLFLESINQLLAGRGAICHLLPFSQHELQTYSDISLPLDDILFTGLFPDEWFWEG